MPKPKTRELDETGWHLFEVWLLFRTLARIYIYLCYFGKIFTCG